MAYQKNKLETLIKKMVLTTLCDEIRPSLCHDKESSNPIDRPTDDRPTHRPTDDFLTVSTFVLLYNDVFMVKVASPPTTIFVEPSPLFYFLNRL